MEGLERLWRKLLAEYFTKHHEYPPLSDSGETSSISRVQQFIGARPEISRAIAGLDMVQDMVVKVALDVLKELEEEEKKK